jgi:hypothetical protein
MVRTGLAAICLALMLWTVSGAAAHRDASRMAVNVSVAGGGKILSNDGRISCGSQCSASYRKGSIRRLTASPNQGFTFVKWDGDCIGTAPICDLALDRSQSTTASFLGKPMEVSLSVGGPGHVVSPENSIRCGEADDGCVATVPYGTSVTLTPEAAADGRFVGWDGPCSAAGTGSCTLTVEGPVETAAAFGHLAPGPGEQPLAVVVENGAHVTSQPLGIDCQPICNVSFLSGTLVTLTRDAYSHWAGGCRGWLLERCRLVVDSPTEVAATTPPPPPIPSRPAIPPPPPVGALLDATVSGKGLVTGERVRCGRAPSPRVGCHNGYIPLGGTYVLHAGSRKGTYFARWGGDCRGRKPTCRIKVPGDRAPIFQVTGLFRWKR